MNRFASRLNYETLQPKGPAATTGLLINSLISSPREKYPWHAWLELRREFQSNRELNTRISPYGQRPSPGARNTMAWYFRLMKTTQEIDDDSRRETTRRGIEYVTSNEEAVMWGNSNLSGLDREEMKRISTRMSTRSARYIVGGVRIFLCFFPSIPDSRREIETKNWTQLNPGDEDGEKLD